MAAEQGEEGELAAEQGELVDALVRSSFAVMAVLSRIGAEHDLSLTQLRMLGILRDRRVKMSELADHLGLDKSTISGLVSRAEKRHLIERAPVPGNPAIRSPGFRRYHRRNVAGIRRARRMTVSPQVVPTLQEPR